jgi:hypothetical protein
MKILLSPTKNIQLAHIYNTASQVKDVQVINWIKGRSLHFMLSNFTPEMIFIDTENITETIVELANTFKIPIIGFGSPTHLFQNADFIFNFTDHANPNYLPPAANLLKSQEIFVNPFDILYSAWYNKEEIERARQANLTFRIVNTQCSNVPEYIGSTNVFNIIDLYKAASIIITTSNLYDIAIHKRFALTTIENPLFPQYTATALTSQTDNLFELIEKHLKPNNIKKQIINNAYHIACENTYFHRLSTIFEKLNHKDISIQCMITLSNILESW